jgi:hypothetical protein
MNGVYPDIAPRRMRRFDTTPPAACHFADIIVAGIPGVMERERKKISCESGRLVK